MKVLCLCFFAICLFSCTQVCNLAQQAADSAASDLASRWQCKNVVALADFLSKPLNLICKDKSLSAEKSGFLTQGICEVVAKALLGLGANGIALKFECNYDLVTGDMGNLSSLCQVLKSR
jgi:hypothetical protein